MEDSAYPRSQPAGGNGEGLATQHDVTERTIWRDMEALQEAGFPLTDEKANGRTRWKLMPNGLKGLNDSGLTIGELALLYTHEFGISCDVTVV